MKRLILIFIFIILGIVFFVTAWRMPVHSETLYERHLFRYALEELLIGA